MAAGTIWETGETGEKVVVVAVNKPNFSPVSPVSSTLSHVPPKVGIEGNDRRPQGCLQCHRLLGWIQRLDPVSVSIAFSNARSSLSFALAAGDFA
jgi:hypothetical protein